jgi:3-hydroxyisobutyrate dehydrogenase-like beta-hydroxyacid dehydrogenase
MARNLLRAGHEVRAWNRTQMKARAHFWLGDAGMGTRLKLVLNSWILGTVENLPASAAAAPVAGS